MDGHGQHSGWVASMTDISEPNRVRAELAAARERFTLVLESLEASVSVAPLGSKELLFANKRYRQWFGDTTQGHLGMVISASSLRVAISEARWCRRSSSLTSSSARSAGKSVPASPMSSITA